MPNQQLVDYINQCLAAGRTKEQIKQSLLSAGWQNKDIEEALGIKEISAIFESLKLFSKPEITNIRWAVWDTIKVRWQFWSVVVFATASSVALTIWFIKEGVGDLIIILAPFLLVVFYFGYYHNKIRISFWKQFAEINGWQYKGSGDSKQESGIMFKQGDDRSISHTIEGVIDGRQFRIIEYDFSVGSGKSKKTYYYAVFAFKFNGSFPHIYLNNKYNSYGLSVGEKIPLSSEFEKRFTLFAPKEYEIEALEIFTPDILANLLDNGFPHDVEFINQEVLIFTNGQINDFNQLEKEFKRALEIEDLLDEKLDKFKFEKIGDMPHILK